MSIFKYLSFYFRASTKYQVHSPFVYDFVENVLEDTRRYYFFDTIEKYRQILSVDKTVITAKQEKIGSLARELVIKKRIGQLLFRLVHHYKPKELLLVGVFPGVATLYQSTPSYKTSIKGLESRKEVANKLNYYFKELGVPNIQLLYGKLNELLLIELAKQPKLSYIYFKELPDRSTLEMIISACDTDSMLLIERPYQNEENLSTWQWLYDNTSVTISIDLYQLGILFFRKEQKEKVHYELIRSSLKPWSVF